MAIGLSGGWEVEWRIRPNQRSSIFDDACAATDAVRPLHIRRFVEWREWGSDDERDDYRIVERDGCRIDDWIARL